MCSMSSQTAKSNTAANKDIVEKLQAMADLYGKTNGMFSVVRHGALSIVIDVN